MKLCLVRDTSPDVRTLAEWFVHSIITFSLIFVDNDERVCGFFGYFGLAVRSGHFPSFTFVDMVVLVRESFCVR